MTDNVDVDSVAYETLARRGELVALEVQDIEFWPNGTGQALIRRGKTDAEGQGRVAYLSRETVKWLKIWLEHAKILEGPIFRRLIGRDEIGDALHPGSSAPIFKRVAQWIGMPARFVAQVSGHSTRVGAAQDLAEEYCFSELTLLLCFRPGASRHRPLKRRHARRNRQNHEQRGPSRGVMETRDR